jgi:hypothetical protein
MTKSAARKKLDGILGELGGGRRHAVSNNMSLGQFIEGVYYPFYTRKWKRSTAGNNINRVNTHVVGGFGDRKVTEFRRAIYKPFSTERAPSFRSAWWTIFGGISTRSLQWLCRKI